MIKKAQTIVLSVLLFMACSKPKETILEHSIDSNIDKLTVNDTTMNAPGFSDWLAYHPEPGQTFKQYIKVKPVRPTNKKTKLYIKPIGKFTVEEVVLINRMKEYLSIFFEMEVVELPAMDKNAIPQEGRRKHWEGHEQFKTTYILDQFQKQLPEDGIVMMGITATDLYPDPNWNFVFGQARTQKRVGVSSFFRYSPQRDSSDYTKCLERLIKTSSHEVCHMFTMQHCIHAVCVMNGSNSVWEADSRPNRLCSECLHKLQWNLGFNTKSRLVSILDYFKKYNLTHDYNYAVQDLTILERHDQLKVKQ